MVTVGQVVALLAVVAVLTAVPGPSVLFVVSRAVTLGRRAALATVVGNETGLLMQGTAVAVGLGAVVRSPRRIEFVGGGSGIVMVGLGAHLALTGGRD
jgi:threonine/homoserine/homoserine lactone efflux protein